MKKLNSKQLRKSEPNSEDFEKIHRTPIYFVLDRIIDTYNTGSLFRLADALAISKMYLCGNMEYPPASRIHKAAVGTENWVPWEKAESSLEVIKRLRDEGVQIVCVEQSPKSIDLGMIGLKLKFPIAIVCGNETEGLPEEVLNEADVIVELPMLGINKSFNVWGSTAVVAYNVLQYLKFPVKKKVKT